MSEFRMPSLGADMDVGTVTQWLMRPGDRVARGDIVAVVDTDKSDVEVEVFESGIVEELLVSVGSEVPVGTVLARIRGDTSATNSSTLSPRSEKPTPSEIPIPEAQPTAEDQAPLPWHGSTSPLIRHLADELHVDLKDVSGTGVGGVITRADVERFAAAQTRTSRRLVSPWARHLAEQLTTNLDEIDVGSGPNGSIVGVDVLNFQHRTARPLEISSDSLTEPPSPIATGVPSTGIDGDRVRMMRQRTAALMARSKREIPHYYLSSEIDMSKASQWLRGMNASRSVTERLLPAALLLRAVSLAASEVPEMNGHWVDDEFRAVSSVHLGVAVSMRGGGLIAPCIANANERNVFETMKALVGLVERVRTLRLRSGDLVDPTITVTNLGDQGAMSVFGVIYPPQVALVGFGKVVDRPWVSEGQLDVRSSVTVTLSADHRASDGQSGSRFLTRIARYLQAPEKL
jgi:pyruvate dehydrogenase E2 component (dihydrolipoamide acetyltransferase)